MRILDEHGNEIFCPDLSRGYLKEETLFVNHHPATNHVEEVWHYETIAEYPNGGKDIKKVIDIPHVEAQESWDEYETIQRYIRYSDDEFIALRQNISIWNELDAAFRKGVNCAYEQ